MNVTSTPPCSSPALESIDFTNMKVHILYGKEVLNQIKDLSFLAEWDHLCEQCPWSTIFQTSDFVCSWYQHYALAHTPIMVMARQEDRLVGLLTLADNIPELGVSGAGGYDAYYHTWISTEPWSDRFISTAILRLRTHLGNKDICFKYLPPHVPTGWFAWDAFKFCHVIRSFNRPIATLNKIDEQKTLQKKSFKEKINRLKRTGELRMETIRDAPAFEGVIDELADFYDFRKLATLNLRPFQDDPQKKRFLVDLVRKGVLEADLLTVNGKICSAITMTTNYKGWSHGAGIIVHNSAYSRFSPGNVILKMSAVRLSQEHVELYDITPGDHSYKEAHADTHDKVLEVRFTHKLKALYMTCYYHTKEAIKTSLAQKGINSRLLNYKFRDKTERFRQQLHVAYPANISRIFFANTRKALVYSVREVKTNIVGNPQFPIKVNSIKDLLHYCPGNSDLSSQDFIKNAMFLMEAGSFCYTVMKDGQLDFLIWLAPPAFKTKEEEFNKVISHLPENATLLYAAYCSRRVKDKFEQFLGSVAMHLSINQAKQPVYIVE